MNEICNCMAVEIPKLAKIEKHKIICKSIKIYKPSSAIFINYDISES